MVRQWRVPAGGALLEIPAGTLDVHDGVTEDPDLCARRELEEETGHRAREWRKLAAFWTAPGFATELMHLYLATGMTGVADDDDRLAPDEDERLELRHVPLADASRWSSAARSATRSRSSGSSGSTACAGTRVASRPALSLGCGQAGERRAVELRRRREGDRQPEVGPRLARPAEALQALAEGVVRVVRRGIDLEHRLERLARALGLGGVEVRPAEGLEDRRLARLQPRRPLQHDRGLGVVVALEQRLPALEQVVGGLALVGRTGAVRRGPAAPRASADPAMVARNTPRYEGSGRARDAEVPRRSRRSGGTVAGIERAAEVAEGDRDVEDEGRLGGGDVHRHRRRRLVRRLRREARAGAGDGRGSSASTGPASGRRRRSPARGERSRPASPRRR